MALGVNNYQENNNQQSMMNNGVNNYQTNGINNQYNYGNQNVYNDEELVDAYIGNNADKIRKGGFSGYTFLFGFFYTLYRKMWLLTVIWYLGALMVLLFLPSFSALTYVINLFICIKFNDLYLKNVRENVNKIKIENSEKSYEELKQICAKKGGTSIVAVIIAVVVYILLMSI